MIRIAIIDDEQLARITLKSMLEELPFPLTIVAEGSKGQDVMILAQKWKPDICFVDIKMPGWDGLQGIREAKGLSPETKWVILTGFSEFEYAREAIHLGVSFFLLKPLDPTELKEKLSMLISQFEPFTQTDQVVIEEDTNNVINKVKRHIEIHYMEDVGIADLAVKLDLTPNYLSTIFHKQTGETFTQFLTKVRLENAKNLLLEEVVPIQEIAEKVGYYSVRHFTKKFKDFYGIYPSECRHSKSSKLMNCKHKKL